MNTAKTPQNRGSKSKIYVEGMHCSSCEILIEKTLEKHDGVKQVKASLDKGEVEVLSEKSEKIDLTRLNQELEQAGYKFSFQKPKKTKQKLISFENRQLSVSREKLVDLLRVVAVLVVVLIIVMLINNSELGRYAGVDASSSLPAFVVLGFIAGLSSCAALIGGLLLVMTKQWHELYIAEDNKFLKYQPHLLFHGGRLLGFFIFGGLLGLLGQAVSLSNVSAFALVVIVVSLVMLILALQMLGVKQANRLKFTTPRFLSKYITNETNFSGKYMPFILGAFTFLLPCGFTLIAQSVALASASFVKGGLIMLFFALGTLPVLLGVSFTGIKFNAKPQMTAIFNKAAGILIIVFAIYTINSQLNVLGVKSLNDVWSGLSIARSEKESEEEIVAGDSPATNPDFQQIVIVANGFSYKAAGSTTVKEGQRAVIAVNNKGVQGCGQFMAAKGLFEGYVQLKQGWNYVEFTPKKGVYKLTCTMGMVPPVTITVI